MTRHKHNEKIDPIYLLYDERMAQHRPPLNGQQQLQQFNDPNKDDYCFENPHRIKCIHNQLMNLQSQFSSDIFVRLNCTPASQDIICLAHSKSHYHHMQQTSKYTNQQLCEMTLQADIDDDDVYYNQDTFLAASLAVGGVIECVDQVTSTLDEPVTSSNRDSFNSDAAADADAEKVKFSSSHCKSNRSLAIVRPPGHHACAHKAMGFCYLNSVAIAAKYALHTQKASKVLILDWDIHHGNGTQDLTYHDPNIFYISLHRAAFGTKSYFYPMTGRPQETSSDGSNLNIAWCQSGMGNVEYAAAFCELILPYICKVDPDLILISCGLDAAHGDLIGDCHVMPDMYYKMTKSILQTLLDIPLVVVLEGGYNLDVIPVCMEAIVLALLNQPYHDHDQNCKDDQKKDPLTPPSLVSSPSTSTSANTTSTATLINEHLIEGFQNMSIHQSSNDNHNDDQNDDNSSGAHQKYDKQQRLQQGREVLSDYWNYNSDNPHQKGCIQIKKAAIRAINQSLRAILATPLYHQDTDKSWSSLTEIPNQHHGSNTSLKYSQQQQQQQHQEKERMTTRSQSRRN